MLVYRITDAEGETRQHATGADGSGHALCGLTVDDDPEIIRHSEIVSGKITCPQCRAIINHCKTLKL